MKLTVYFEGWAEVDTNEIPFADGFGMIKHVYDLAPDELEHKLRGEKLFITLQEVLNVSENYDIELKDFEVK